MRNKTIYTALIILCIIGFWIFENFYKPDNYTDPSVQNTKESFKKDFLPRSRTGQIVNHQYYILSYSEPHEQAEWVAYQLKKEHLTYYDRERPYFIEDPNVKSKSADWRNYKRSGYDRGHLCPAGDRRFSEYAYNETFYTSNIVPQRKDFNAGVWNRLEQQVRQWCKTYGDIFIITGGILEDGLPEIGDEDVDVPNQFFKIVFREQNDEINALGFLIPHKESQKPLQSFLVPIDIIELESGLDFFYKMDENQQQDFESSKTTKGWRF